MRVIKPLCLGLMTRPFEQGRRFYMGASVLCFVALGPEEALFSEIGMWKLAAEELPPRQAGAIIKNEEKCIRCGLCADRCPTGAITMESLERQEREIFE